MNRPKRMISLNGEEGFSLVDVVVTIAIVLALSVGGFVSYNGLISSSRQNAVDYAASNVYKNAVIHETDNDELTTACSAIDDFNRAGAGTTAHLKIPDATVTGGFKYYYGAGKVNNTYAC